MIKFLRNLFKRKEKHYFISYFYTLSNNQQGWGQITLADSMLNPDLAILDGATEYVKKISLKDDKAKITIMFFTSWKQYR